MICSVGDIRTTALRMTPSGDRLEVKPSSHVVADPQMVTHSVGLQMSFWFKCLPISLSLKRKQSRNGYQDFVTKELVLLSTLTLVYYACKVFDLICMYKTVIAMCCTCCLVWPNGALLCMRVFICVLYMCSFSFLGIMQHLC